MSLLEGKELEALSAEELLSLDIENVADVEGFKAFPSALFAFTIKEFGIEEVGKEKKKALQMELELTSVVEAVNEKEQEELDKLELPRKYKETYFLTGGKGFGLRLFVTVFRVPAEENGWKTVQDIMENAVGFSGQALIKKRTWKNSNDEEQEGNQIDASAVAFD